MALSSQQTILKDVLDWIYLRCTPQMILQNHLCYLNAEKRSFTVIVLNGFVFIFLEQLFHLIIIEEFHLILSLGAPEFIILSNLYLI